MTRWKWILTYYCSQPDKYTYRISHFEYIGVIEQYTHPSYDWRWKATIYERHQFDRSCSGTTGLFKECFCHHSISECKRWIEQNLCSPKYACKYHQELLNG
jgi:proline racemase